MYIQSIWCKFDEKRNPDLKYNPKGLMNQNQRSINGWTIGSKAELEAKKEPTIEI